MDDKKVTWLLRTAIILVGLFGVAICAFWWPFSTTMTTFGINTIIDMDRVTEAQMVEFWVQFVFYQAVSLPCFAILVFAWLVTNRISKGQFFEFDTAKLIRIASWILYIDLIIFFIGNLVFMFLKWNDFAIIYYFLGAIGVAVALCMSVIAYYVKKSAELKEETEGIV
ncbi:MAG: DUF2975 domain-containing protein [Clostridia bacterium]|nr:DUF2975 domain-containing protein [Clostridia bacterium]